MVGESAVIARKGLVRLHLLNGVEPASKSAMKANGTLTKRLLLNPMLVTVHGASDVGLS